MKTVVSFRQLFACINGYMLLSTFIPPLLLRQRANKRYRFSRNFCPMAQYSRKLTEWFVYMSSSAIVCISRKSTCTFTSFSHPGCNFAATIVMFTGIVSTRKTMDTVRSMIVMRLFSVQVLRLPVSGELRSTDVRICSRTRSRRDRIT